MTGMTMSMKVAKVKLLAERGGGLPSHRRLHHLSRVTIHINCQIEMILLCFVGYVLDDNIFFNFGFMLFSENMTSWEGFNYALVGLVDELISLGVDPGFKTTVLRLWTAYLAKMEVAFISKTEPVLPKLGPNFKHW